MVCGLYPAKEPALRFVFQSLPGAVPDPRTGLVEIASAGLGFVLMKRVVIEKLVQAFPASRCNLGPGARAAHDIFPSGSDGRGGYLSECDGFARLWRSLGGKIYADPAIRLTHIGTHTFSGDPSQLTATAVGAAAAA